MIAAKHAAVTSLEWQEEYKAGNPQVAQFYAGPCWDVESAVRRRVPGDWEPLQPVELAEWSTFLKKHGAPSEALIELDKLRRPETLVVVTGQQTGAALGPLYTIYKALAAIHWARQVEAQTGRPCVAVFWAASDDHDIEEIRHATWLGKDGGLRSDPLLPAVATTNAPAFQQVIDSDAATGFLDAIRRSYGQTLHSEEVLRGAAAALGAGANFESQFVRLLLKWLGPLGLVPVVPRLGLVRRRGSRIMAQEIAQFQSTNKTLQEMADSLAEHGVSGTIHRGGNEANFFVVRGSERGKVVAADSRFVSFAPGSSEVLDLSPGELREMLDANPEKFSPNVATRPLVQDVVFPSVAYVAGPGELVYHAQLGPLYEQFDVVRPALVPRPNVVLVEPRVARALERLGMEPESAATSTLLQFEGRLASIQMKSGRSAAVGMVLDELRKSVESLDPAIGELGRDTGIARASMKLKRSLEVGAEKLAERVAHFELSQDEARARARQRVLDNVFPGGSTQERAVGVIAPFLVNHGPGLFARLLEQIDFKATGTQAIPLA